MQRVLPFCAVAVLSLACSSGRSAFTGLPADAGAEGPDAHVPDGGADVISEEVTVAVDGRSVAGTLTLPAGSGPFPALMLIAGSGPTNRDWLSPLLPGEFGSGRLLAEALAAQGVATMRYDKLGAGASAAPAVVSWQDYQDEQVAVLDYLRTEPRVDAARVVIAGHSEGGLHALRLFPHLEHKPAAVILLATAGEPFEALIARQIDDQLRLAGVSDTVREHELTALHDALAAVVAGRAPDLEAFAFAGVRALVQSLLDARALPFVRELIGLDPRPLAAQLTGPVLVLQGEKDVQVRPDDATALTATLRQAGQTMVTELLSPLADHVLKREDRPFETLDPALVGAGYGADRPLAPDVVPAIVAFVQSL